MNIETLAIDACRAVDHLTTHLVANALTNDAAADFAELGKQAKAAVRMMLPEPVADRLVMEESSPNFPPVKPTVTPSDLPGSEDDDEGAEVETGEEGDEPSVPAPETEPAPDAYAVPV